MDSSNYPKPPDISSGCIADVVTQKTVPESVSWSGDQDPRLKLPVEIVRIRGVPEGTEQEFAEEMLQYPEISTAFQKSVVIPFPT